MRIYGKGTGYDFKEAETSAKGESSRNPDDIQFGGGRV
jgi:hypothetical protein